MRPAFLTVTMFLLLWGGVVAQAAVETNGPVASYAVTNSPAGNPSFIFTLTNGVAEVTPYAPDVVRVRFHFGSLYPREEVAIAKPFTNWPAFAVSYTNQSTNLLITTSQLQIEVVLSNRFQVHFREVAGRELLRDGRMEFDLDYQMLNDTSAYAQVNWPNGTSSVSNRPAGFKLKAVKTMPADAAFFGAGDFGGPLNRRGSVLQFWGQDVYQFTEAHNPKYTALPFWYGFLPATVSNAAVAYGLFFNNPARPVVDFSLGNGTYTFEAGDDQLDYFFFGGGADHQPERVIDRFSELTGRPAFFPKWAYGYHQSRHSYFNQQTVLDLIGEFRALEIPCDAVYLDIGVQDTGNGQFTFSPTAFTNVPALSAYATNQGVRLVPIVEPMLTTNDPLYADSVANTRFLKQNSLANYVGTNFLGGISWLDFSIEETRNWWHAQLTNYLATYGFEAIWNDLTEPNENAMPLDNLWYLDGRYPDSWDTRRWHSNNKNTYALLTAQASDRALRAQQPSKRPFVLTRGAWPGVQAYAAGWSGDNVSSFDHLRFNTRLAMSTMISGQANFGNDVGGFVNDTTPELLTRWLQAGVFSPLYRNHSTLETINQEPWEFGEPYTLWNRRTIQFRYQLMPYLYTLAYQASTNGVPMNVPVSFYYVADTNTWSQSEYDFLVGRDLLAAPVVSSGAVTRTTYLPAGSDWYFAGDDRRYAGGQTVEVRASLGALPYFVRAGAIVPQGPAMAYADAITPDFLDVHVWPGASNVFTLYEDDGVSTNFKAGVFARTPMQVAGSATSLLVTLGPRSGTFSPPARDWYVVAHAMSNATQVTAGGVPLLRVGNRDALAAEPGSAWCLDTVTRQVLAKVADTNSQVELVFSGSGAGAGPSGFASSYSNVAVAGTFTFWNEAARNMELVADHTWAGVLSLASATNAAFKFVANDAWTAANWGETNQASAVIPLAQTAEPWGGDIALTTIAAGLYTFRFNETSLAYSVTFASAQDSDGDGASDAWEVAFGLHPGRAADGALDLDGDGLANSNEYAAGASPVRTDTDDDWLGDGEEWVAGTAASNAASFFAVSGHTPNPTNTGMLVSWSAVTGRVYDLFIATNLLDPAAWSVLPPFSNLTGNGDLTIPDTNQLELRHYRIGVRREP